MEIISIKNWINNLLSDLEMYSIHCIISSVSFHVHLNPVGVEAHVGVDPGVARPGAADAPAGEAGEEHLGALGVDQRPPAVPLTRVLDEAVARSIHISRTDFCVVNLD